MQCTFTSHGINFRTKTLSTKSYSQRNTVHHILFCELWDCVLSRITRDKRLNSHSRSDSSRSSSPLGRQPQKRATNLPKFRIATFYASDVELWFNQIETQFALHQIEDDDERYSLTCAALSGEIASDVRDVLLQPFRSNKYDSLKAILIERRGLTTPERVNKVISGEKIGSDIPSRFLRRLQKTAGFGTKAVVGKASKSESKR